MRDEFPVVNRAPGKRLPPRPVQEIACSRCPATASISAAPSRQPDHTVALKFRQRGWRVVGQGKHVCPACVAAEAERRKAHPVPAESTAMAQKPQPSPPAAPANENVGHASPAASDAIVNLYLLLSDHYDKARKAYADGWDDDRAAKEAGLSPVMVAERREKDFGPLVKDTTRLDLSVAIKDLGHEIQTAEVLHREAVKSLHANGNLIAELRRRFVVTEQLVRRLLSADDKAA